MIVLGTRLQAQALANFRLSVNQERKGGPVEIVTTFEFPLPPGDSLVVSCFFPLPL